MAQSTKHYHAWTTDHELDFLRQLGRSLPEAHVGVKFGQLLYGYARALDRRAVWGDIDETTVRQHVAKLLAAHEERR